MSPPNSRRRRHYVFRSSVRPSVCPMLEATTVAEMIAATIAATIASCIQRVRIDVDTSSQSHGA